MRISPNAGLGFPRSSTVRSSIFVRTPRPRRRPRGSRHARAGGRRTGSGEKRRGGAAPGRARRIAGLRGARGRKPSARGGCGPSNENGTPSVPNAVSKERATGPGTGRPPRSPCSQGCAARTSARISSPTSSRLPGLRRLRETDRALERRRLAGSTRCEELCARRRRESAGGHLGLGGQELLDFTVSESREIVHRGREGGENGAARLVGERDGDVGAPGKCPQERPLGAGQVLEAIGEDRPSVPGIELVFDAMHGWRRSRSRSQRPNRSKLAEVGGVERGRGDPRRPRARAGLPPARRSWQEARR